MANSYPVGFYFQLTFKGEITAFQEVLGLSNKLNVEEIVSGGENRFKYKLPTTISNQNLILKQSLVFKESELVKWCTSTLDQGFVNAIKTQDVSVSLLDSNGAVLMMWTFHNAYPVKYSISDLKSQENEIVIESVELAYTYFEVLSKT